jgi:hypothetical protein
MAPGIGPTRRPTTTSIPSQTNVSGASGPGVAQAPGQAQAPKGGPSVSTDQYGSAKGPGANPTAGPSLQVPDKLNRSSQRAPVDSDVHLPADSIKAANQKIVDQTSKEVSELVKKGDPQSQKAAVDKLFMLKEPELAATLQKLKDSGDLKKLYNDSGKDNQARLLNTVLGHGSEESKKTFGDGIKMTRQEMLDMARNFGGLAKAMEEQNKSSPPAQDWGKPNPKPSNPDLWKD